jgi:dinuclear metal center YbgI/SA1388 family protein
MNRKEQVDMVLCKDVLNFMDQIAPFELAEEWDNIGLMAGSGNAEVKKILVCLDVTTDALRYAAEVKADLIVAHHPMIFKGLKRVCDDEAKGRMIYTAVRNGIGVISAHTNLDYADMGVNVQLASVLELSNTEILGGGPGRVGMLEKRMNFDEFVMHVKGKLDVPHIRVAGKVNNEIQKVAVFSGSFDDDLDAVLQSGADAVVTGDIKHHTALDACEAGICIIDAGHFATERVVLPYLAGALKKRFSEIETFCFEQETDPFITY